MFLEHKEQGERSREEGSEIHRLSLCPYKLSDAIRIGAKLRPQCTGVMFANGGSCALGAAYEALFGWPGNLGLDFKSCEVQRQYQKQMSEVFRLPTNPASCIGTFRNDRGWTREQVADWLESEGY